MAPGMFPRREDSGQEARTLEAKVDDRRRTSGRGGHCCLETAQLGMAVLGPPLPSRGRPSKLRQLPAPPHGHCQSGRVACRHPVPRPNQLLLLLLSALGLP